MSVQGAPSSNIIEQQLDSHLDCLGAVLGADVLVFCGGILYGVDDIVRNCIEHIKNKKNKLAVVLETTGGYVEVAKRIAETLRKNYDLVEFIVPNYAFSAGTILVMSGDVIHMDYYSVLGPIDPQVQRPGGGQMIPALGYLVQYERLIKSSKERQLTSAEITYLVEKFDPAELYRYEQARELSITLLKEWLVKYKFKNWKKTKTRKKTVTKAMKTRRASEIAKQLNKTEKWHSHGHGITMEVLIKDLKLEIEDFGSNEELNEGVRSYYKLLKDYMMKMGHTGVTHTHNNYVPFRG